MKSYLLLLLFPTLLTAQYRVVDATDQTPIPFATVASTTDGWGTVCDEAGAFDTGGEARRVVVSAVGFLSVPLPLRPRQKDSIIGLEPIAYELESATVRAGEFSREKAFGDVDGSNKATIYFINNQGGAQVGRVINLKRESWAKAARIQVTQNSAGPIRCRLKFYRMEDKAVTNEQLTKQDIFITFDQPDVYEIDLKEADLILPERVLMVVELVDQPPSNATLQFGAQLMGKMAYARRNNEEGWRKMDTGIPLATANVCFELTVAQ